MYDDYDGYLENDDTNGYPLCPYDEKICVLQRCSNCDVKKCYEDQ